jgi:hypothetical protein
LDDLYFKEQLSFMDHFTSIGYSNINILILRWIFRKLDGVVGTGWSWLRIGTGGGHL